MMDHLRGRSSTWSAGSTFLRGESEYLEDINYEYRLSCDYNLTHSNFFDDDVFAAVHYLKHSDYNDSSTTLGISSDFESHDYQLPRSKGVDRSLESYYDFPYSHWSTKVKKVKSSPPYDESEYFACPSPSTFQSCVSVTLPPALPSFSPETKEESNFINVSPFSTASSNKRTKCSSCPEPISKELSPSSVIKISTEPSVQHAALISPLPNSVKRHARRNPWGSETYSDLIAHAILSYPEKQATLQQIYDYISKNYTYFRERSDPPASAGWKNSIRHNLSLHDKFIKCPKVSESAKSSHWRLNSSSPSRSYVRRRACSMELATMKKAKFDLMGRKFSDVTDFSSQKKNDFFQKFKEQAEVVPTDSTSNSIANKVLNSDAFELKNTMASALPGATVNIHDAKTSAVNRSFGSNPLRLVYTPPSIAEETENVANMNRCLCSDLPAEFGDLQHGISTRLYSYTSNEASVFDNAIDFKCSEDFRPDLSQATSENLMLDLDSRYCASDPASSGDNPSFQQSCGFQQPYKSTVLDDSQPPLTSVPVSASTCGVSTSFSKQTENFAILADSTTGGALLSPYSSSSVYEQTRRESTFGLLSNASSDPAVDIPPSILWSTAADFMDDEQYFPSYLSRNGTKSYFQNLLASKSNQVYSPDPDLCLGDIGGDPRWMQLMSVESSQEALELRISLEVADRILANSRRC